MTLIKLSCFAMEIRGWVRHSSCKHDYSLSEQRVRAVLTDCGYSSLVVDRLCDQATGQSTAVTCFYFDFAVQKEQSAASMLGSLLKQIVNGMEKVPEEIWRTFREQKKTIGGRGLQLADGMKMLQLVTSSQNTFICIDALDECAGAQRARLLDALCEILAKSPGTRIFVTGRPYIQAETERRLVGRVISVSVGPIRSDIITYLRARLRDDEIPDAMDESLEEDILEKIRDNISEMCLTAVMPGIPPYAVGWWVCIGFYSFP